MTDLLLARYQMAYAEYRGEVLLGSERQLLFVILNPTVVAFGSYSAQLADLALVLAALASCVGILLVTRSHQRYQRTRGVLLERAKELGAEADWQTTGGMREARGEPRWEGPRVTTAIKVLLALYVAFDVLALARLWSAP